MKRRKLPEWGEAHIHLARLELEPGCFNRALTTLSPGEMARANCLPGGTVRERFIAGRLFLRQLLSSYLGIRAHDIQIHQGKWGKPHLAPQMEAPSLAFNLSHSADLAVAAVATGTEVGVDIEFMAEDLPYANIASLFFSPTEKRMLNSLDHGGQLAAFYRCWTRKEAYLKGCGRGLSLPADSFDVTLLPGVTPAISGHRLDPGEVERWSIVDLPLPDGFCAALAFEGPAPIVRCHFPH